MSETTFRVSEDGRAKLIIVDGAPLNTFKVIYDNEVIFEKQGDFDGAMLAFQMAGL